MAARHSKESSLNTRLYRVKLILVQGWPKPDTKIVQSRVVRAPNVQMNGYAYELGWRDCGLGGPR